MRKHVRWGTTDREWFQNSIDEAKSDPEGFWAIIKTGRHGFELKGQDLEVFLFEYVFAMLNAGANPVVGDRSRSSGWRPVYHYGESATDAATAIVAEWKASGVDPDFAGLWFAFPPVHR